MSTRTRARPCSALTAAGVLGILRLPDNVLHLIVGLNADQYAAEMKAAMAG